MPKPGRIAYTILVIFFSSLVLLTGTVALVLAGSLVPNGISLENAMARPLSEWAIVGLIAFFAAAFLVQGSLILIRSLLSLEKVESGSAVRRPGQSDDSH